MAYRVSRGSNILLLCLVNLLIASCHCTRLTKLKALDELRRNSTHIHDQAKGSELCHGRLLIGHNSLQGVKFQGIKATRNSLALDRDYQADMGWGQPEQPQEQVDGFSESKSEDAAVKQLLKMEPKVECTVGSMKLKVQDAASTPGSLFLVDRGSHLSPLPLSKLPSSCGYTFRSTQKDLVLVAPYDGCFVALEEDSYVLPLRWLGLPVKMSCPLSKKSSSSPPMVTCHAEGMVVKTEWSGSDIKVNLNGNWEPLMKASIRCGFGVVVHPEGVVVSVRYAPCLEKKDGLYTLELAGYGQTKISCPSLSSAQPEGTKTNKYPAVLQVPGHPAIAPATKPKTAPRTSQPEAPQGQVYQPFYLNPWPGPGTVPATNPTAAPKPPQPETAPQGQVYQSFYPQPKPENGPEPAPTTAPKPPQPEAAQGQVYQPFYPNPFFLNPFYPQPKPENAPEPAPTTAPKPPQPEAPQGQVYQPFYLNPWPGPGTVPATNPIAAPKPPQPETAPQGQVYQSFYPQPKPENGSEPAPTTAPKPPQPEAAQGQVYQPFYPNPFFLNPFYPQPKPENAPEPAPTTAPKPPQPEAPQGQVYQPFYPQPEHLPAEKPTAVPKPAATEMSRGQVYKPYAQQLPGAGSNGEHPAVKPPQGQLLHPFNPYHFPRWPQPATLPPATLLPATSNREPQQFTTPASSETPPEVPQSSSYMPPVFCPQFCAPGFSNCCPQIAFHQHLHHIVPAGPGSKDAHPVYTGLPFPSVAYYGYGFGSPPLPQKTNDAITASTSASQSPSGNGKQPYNQPPGGNPVAVPESNPSKHSNPEQQMYPYFVPNIYPSFPHNPQPKWQNDLSTGYMNNPSGPNVSFIDQNLQQHTAMWQNKPIAEEQQPSNEQLIGSNKHEQTMNADTGAKNYLLLQHGPPGRDFSELPLPFRYLGHETSSLAQNNANNQGSINQYLQNFRPPQEKPKLPKWLGKGNSSPFPDINMPRPGDELDSLHMLTSSTGPRFLPVPQDPSFSAHAKPKTDSFKFFMKPMPTLGPSQRFPPYVPGHPFQQWISAANNQGNELNQPIQGEGGNPKQMRVVYE